MQEIVDSSNETNSPFKVESLISFSMEADIKELPSNLMEVKDLIYRFGDKGNHQICIETSTPLVLILIPLLLPLRDRVQVRIILEDKSKTHQYGDERAVRDEIRHNRKFRELLEAAQALSSHSIAVCFSQKAI
jgi:hypothetical protein